MRKMLAGVALAVAALASGACSGRQATVQTGSSAQAETSVAVTNNLSQAVNVYVMVGGNDMFLRQVPAGSSETLEVRGVASGTSVTLKATTVDGTRTYTRPNVTLQGTTTWQVP